MKSNTYAAIKCANTWLGHLGIALLAVSLAATTGWSQTKAQASAISGGGTQKLRVSDRALSQLLVTQGAVSIADYGGFQLLRVSGDLAGAWASHPAAQEVTEQNLILLNVRHLDTTAPEVVAMRTAVAGGGKRLHLVQFAGPIKPEWEQQLRANGGTIVTYIPHNTYLVYADGAALQQVQAWAASAPHVQWEGPYLDDFKIDRRARLVDAKGQAQKPATSCFTIQMVADPEANAATLAVIDRLKLEPIRQQYEFIGYFNVTVRLPAERLAEIAAQPEVVSIQPFDEPRKRDERQDQIVAGNLAGPSPSGPGYLAWLQSKGFTQAQFTTSAFAVDVTDSGIDNGTTAPGHFGLYTGGDTNQPSRVVYNRLEGTPNSGSTLQGCDGHGTLNTHIIGGLNNAAVGFPHTDSLGYRYGLGICPFVRFGSSVIFDPDTYTSPNIPNLASEAFQDGARITSNSWGANTSGGYNASAQAYDAVVRDAQAAGSTYPTAGNQEMVVVFAAGNAGPSTGTVGAPGTAKNVITVGAAENVRSMTPANGGNDASGNDGCSVPDSGADNANDIIDFSSRGPCADGRTKPDICAPGTHITGGVAQNNPPPDPSGTGSALACFLASGVCALPGSGSMGSSSNFFPLGQQFYTESSGTSHSTPAVAGCCALVRQDFLNHGLNAPSPAMTKAYLMNSARYMTGVNANDSLWSNNQGLGEANLGMAFDGTARILRDELFGDKFTATGQTRSWTGHIADGTKPFRVTVAWTDAPGSTTGNAYLNDLDLVVTVGGNTYKGNVFSGAFSTTGGTADSRNNVESVFVPAGVTGAFAVTVNAANINSDGVPNEDPALDQDFALVIYNGIEVPAPIIVPSSAVLTVESCPPANRAVDPGETVTMNFGLSNIGSSNTAALAAELLATNGVMVPSGPQPFGVLLAGGPAVAQPFSFTASGLCGGTIHPTFRLTDGTNDLGTVVYSLPLGVSAPVFTENFDSASVPALPAGWTTLASGGESLWTTSTTLADSAPNSAFAPDASSAGVNELDSPSIPVPSAGAQLSFRHNYATEPNFDGCVLEIKIGGGAYADILTAGGSFASGGYNGTVNGGTANPLTNRPAWTGTAGEFTTTIVNLPPSATGQTVQFRWRIGSDGSVGAAGWYVDTVTLSAPFCCGDASAPVAGFTGTPLVGAVPLAVTFTDTSIGAITNRAWDFGNGTTTNTTATNFVYHYPSPGTFTVSLTAQGPYGNSTLTLPSYVSVTNSMVVPVTNGYSLITESCPSGGIDPGETVTVNLNLKNVGSAPTTNLVATLLASGGVTSPTGPQIYGALAAGGGSASLPFTFYANGSCGGSLTATLQLQDGTANYGTVSFDFILGTLGTSFSQNFDGVNAPALPSGWTTTATGAQSVWTTSTASNDTPPNAAFSPDPSSAGVNEFVSPVITIPVSGGQLSFKNNYNLEAPATGTSAYDGGVLEIKIGAGAFTDIQAAGASFASGGYNRTINASTDPLNGRACWSSSSGGFTDTVVNLPPAASGQPVQFKWRCGADSSVSKPGWWIDDIAVMSLTCCSDTSPPQAGFTGAPLNGAAPLTVTFTDISVGNITNRHWDFGNGVTTNTTATNVVFTYLGAGAYDVSLTAAGPYGTNTLTRPAYVTVTNPVPVLAGGGLTLLLESCPSGGIDPGENVTVSLSILNNGTAPTTNLVATLLATGGVTSPGSPQTYGAVPPGGGAVSRSFTFTAVGTCGDTDIATLQLQDGATAYGTLSFPFVLGVVTTTFSQDFDSVTAPALPPGWGTTASGAQSPWVTSTTLSQTAPNAAFSTDASAVGDNALDSPPITLSTGESQLSFKHSYDLEASSGTTGYDGGVLEISIAGGAFTDIITAGGTFVTNGYNRTISSSYSNPLADRQAWSGTSGGFTNTIVTLPPAAAGQAVQFRWRCASDSSFGLTGWYVDTITVTSRSCCTANRPALLQPRIDLNGHFTCFVSGGPGNYTVETSTDYVHWSTAGVVTVVSGQIAFTDTNPLDTFRIYRARQ